MTVASETRIEPNRLTRFAAHGCQAVGIPAADADLLAAREAVARAKAHGVGRSAFGTPITSGPLPTSYKGVRKGLLLLAENLKALRENGPSY